MANLAQLLITMANLAKFKKSQTNFGEMVSKQFLQKTLFRFFFQTSTIYRSKANFTLFFSAISVLLGEAWKSLPNEERESYSNKAKVLADEQKKIYPDCWKRKKTVATTGTGNDNNMKANQNHTIIHPSAEAPAQK